MSTSLSYVLSSRTRTSTYIKERESPVIKFLILANGCNADDECGRVNPCRMKSQASLSRKPSRWRMTEIISAHVCSIRYFHGLAHLDGSQCVHNSITVYVTAHDYLIDTFVRLDQTKSC
jgi:hypothetical protein